MEEGEKPGQYLSEPLLDRGTDVVAKVKENVQITQYSRRVQRLRHDFERLVNTVLEPRLPSSFTGLSGTETSADASCIYVSLCPRVT